jgi:hypothetical protein
MPKCDGKIMPVRFHSLLTVGVTALLAAGCSILPFGNDDSRDAPPPPPLAAAPTGSVTGAPLPPPEAAGATMQPSPSGLTDPSLQTAAVSPPPAAIGSGQMGRTDLLGGWTINSAGESCQLFMTLTTWAGGYRASTRGCTGASLQTVSAWNMEGSQVQLLNDAGTTVARLYPSSKTQFSGQTEGGGPITVSR